VRSFGSPDWTVNKPASKPCDVALPTNLPVLPKLEEIDLSLTLEEVRSVPFKSGEQKCWTKRERELAEKATVARDLEDLEDKVGDCSSSLLTSNRWFLA
jgi:hypothetical protein